MEKVVCDTFYQWIYQTTLNTKLQFRSSFFQTGSSPKPVGANKCSWRKTIEFLPPLQMQWKFLETEFEYLLLDQGYYNVTCLKSSVKWMSILNKLKIIHYSTWVVIEFLWNFYKHYQFLMLTSFYLYNTTQAHSAELVLQRLYIVHLISFDLDTWFQNFNS